MAFADKLKQRREAQELTQEDVAGFFNDCSRQAVSNWERGSALPEAEKLLMLSVKLDISLDELFADELVYLKRGKVEVSELDKHPGMVAGLKLLAEKLKLF